MSGRQIVSKITVQALLATAVTFTVCYGFIAGRIEGEAFIGLALLPLAWAFRQSGAEKA